MIDKIPTTWRTVELRDIATLLGGGTPSRKNAAFFQGDIPWITGADIAEDKLTFLHEAREYITGTAIRASATNRVPQGTVLITTRVNVGKVAITQTSLCFSQDVTAIVLSNTELVDRQYLAYFLLANRDRIRRFNQGTTITGIRKNDLERVSLPLPTLPEQREIVKTLRQADRLRQLRAEADEQSELLALATFNQIFGYIEKKSSYKQTKLGKVAKIVSGVTKGRNLPPHETVTAPYLRVANVQDGYLDLSEVKTIDVMPTDVEKYALKNGDVVLTEGGDFDKLGRGAVWDENIPNCIHQNHVFRVRVDQNSLLPLFFNYYLQTAYARNYFLRAAKRTTNLASINKTQLSALPVPIPPMEMQERFVDAAKKIDSLRATQTDSRAEIDRLFSVMMVHAFTGQLTREFRERREVELAQDAIERDTALTTSPSQAIELQSDADVDHPKRTGVRAKLSVNQLALLDSIENHDAYITDNDLDIGGNLLPNEMKRDLDLLTRLGLIKSVYIRVVPGTLGQIFFAKIYRALHAADNVRDTDLLVFHEARKE